jgi:hypothetical protein
LTYDCDVDQLFLPLLFPDLKVQIETIADEERPASYSIVVKVFKPISTGCLFNHLLRTPMRGDMENKRFLLFPRCVCELELFEGGQLFDDGALVFGEEPLESSLLRQWNRSIIIHNRSLSDIGGFSNDNGNPGSTKRIIDTLFEVLKIAGWSDDSSEVLMQYPDELRRQLQSEIGPRQIIVSLSTSSLFPLIEHVSRDKPICSLAFRLISYSYAFASH